MSRIQREYFRMRYYAAQEIVKEWVDQQGHDRCWYYPDLFRKLQRVLNVYPTREPFLPPLEEFKHGCEHYQQEEYGLKHLNRDLPSSTHDRYQAHQRRSRSSKKEPEKKRIGRR